MLCVMQERNRALIAQSTKAVPAVPISPCQASSPTFVAVSAEFVANGSHRLSDKC